MIGRLNYPWCVVLFVLVSCTILFGQISVDTIAKYGYSGGTVFIETKLINGQDELDSLLKNTGYDSTRSSIKLTKQPSFEQVTVFAFIGWPCSVDSIVEGQNTITIEYLLDYYDDQLNSSRPADEIKICALLKTAKTIIFVNKSLTNVKHRSLSPTQNKRKVNISQKQFDFSGKVLQTSRTGHE